MVTPADAAAKTGGAARGTAFATAAGAGEGPGGPGGAPVPTLTVGASGILAMRSVSCPFEIDASWSGTLGTGGAICCTNCSVVRSLVSVNAALHSF